MATLLVIDMISSSIAFHFAFLDDSGNEACVGGRNLLIDGLKNII